MNIGANTGISQSQQAAQHQAQQKRNPPAPTASATQEASSPQPAQPHSQPVAQSQPPASNNASHSGTSSGSGNPPPQGSAPQRTPQPNDAQSALALINGVPQHQVPQQQPPHASSRTGQNVNVTA